MSVLTYKHCACLRRGVAFRPGSRGHLYLRIGGREVFLRRCTHCRPKDERLQLNRKEQP